MTLTLRLKKSKKKTKKKLTRLLLTTMQRMNNGKLKMMYSKRNYLKPSLSMLGLLLVCLTSPLLTSCGKKDSIPVIQYNGVSLPKLPQNLARVYPDPGVREGKSAFVELARNRTWGKRQAAQHEDFVRFYTGLYNSQPKVKKKP